VVKGDGSAFAKASARPGAIAPTASATARDGVPWAQAGRHAGQNEPRTNPSPLMAQAGRRFITPSLPHRPRMRTGFARAVSSPPRPRPVRRYSKGSCRKRRPGRLRGPGPRRLGRPGRSRGRR